MSMAGNGRVTDIGMSDGVISQVGRMFILAGSFLFAPFFFAFAVLEVSNQNGLWRPKGVTHPPAGLGLAAVILLLVCGLVYMWGQWGLYVGLAGRFKAGMALAFVCAVAAAVCYIITLHKLGFGPQDGGYASVFLGLTGVYLTALLCMVVYLAGLANRARLGLYTRERMAAVNAFGEFLGWFVAIGIGAFALLYIVPFISIE